MLSTRFLRFAFCYEQMVSSKAHQLKEKELVKNKVYIDNKTLFSKD